MRELISEEELFRAEKELREQASHVEQHLASLQRQHWLFRHAGALSIIVAIVLNTAWEMAMDEAARTGTSVIVREVRGESMSHVACGQQPQPEHEVHPVDFIIMEWL